MEYTLAQFHAYLALASQRWRNQARWQLLANSAAFGGGKALKALLNALK